MPVITSSPRQVLQSDANDRNLVVTPDGKHIAAIFDFGDMVYSYRVNELAICIAYGE